MISYITNRNIRVYNADNQISYNSDYIAEFHFDEEWNGKVKTARFVQNGEYVDVVLTNDRCEIPPLKTGFVRVGVFTDSMTSTYADVYYKTSIKDGSGNPAKPPEDVYAQLTALIESGILKGDDGLTPYVGSNNNWWIGDIDTGVLARGTDGEDGYTPVKGVDYFTEEEIQQIQNEVSGGAIGDFKAVVDEKTATFNTNAENTLTDYNANAQEKFDTYNTNADSKFETYNTNAETKFSEYTSNAETKLSKYNKNDLDKTTLYNTNADSKFSTYNENAETKFSEYTNNADTKLAEYNQNDSDKTTLYNANAESKLDAYDSNAQAKLDLYNQNAAEKSEAYNQNHTEKVAEYNANAETKTAEFDSNAAALQTEVDRLRGEFDTLAEAAAGSAANAATSEENALEYKTAAQLSKEAAATSENKAAESEANAKLYAEQAGAVFALAGDVSFSIGDDKGVTMIFTTN